MNKAERWHRISELFDRVVELPASEREAVLATECADDPQLRIEVQRLLQADERTNPIDQDIAGQASTLLLEGDAHEHEGQQFGPYRIVKLLAQGGMGRVYLAEREGEDFAQTVALKLVGGYGSFDAYIARRRFLDERRILARLQHPNIARLLDGGVGPEAQPWFAMEYVDGAPLTDWCDTHRLDVRQRLNLFAKVCEAVDHAHRFLIVHRDLKPGNVLVDHRGEPKVLDFGIAKLLDEGASERTGSTILMTPDYAAPEQIRGGQISTATDVYALGAVLFEVLTGRKPFCDPLASREAPQASRVATEGVHAGERANARATTPHALRKRLRGDIDRILRTALDPEPVRRYRSAAALAEDLRAVADGRAISLRSDRAYRIGIFLRRHKWETAAAAVAILGLLGTTGWALWQTQQATVHAQTSQRHAREEARQAELAKKEAKAAMQASDLLISAFSEADPSSRATLREPTARDILDATSANVATALADQPDLLARMRLALGRAYLNLGDEKAAATLLEQARTGFLETKPRNLIEGSEAASVLAMLELNQGHNKRAVALAREAVALRAKTGGDIDDMINAINNLSMMLMQPGQYAESERLVARTYAMRVKQDGILHSRVADSLNNWGRLSSLSGKLRQADRLFSASLNVKRAIKLPEMRSWGTRGVMALNMIEQGRLVEAEAASLENLRLVPSFYPDDSTRMTLLHYRIGLLFSKKGDLNRALLYLRKATARQKDGTRQKQASLTPALETLAAVLETRGDISEAGKILAEAQAVANETYPPGDNQRLRIKAVREAFLARHAAKPAEDDLRTALAEWIAPYGQERKYIPSDLADALFLESERLLALGQYESAEAILPPEDPSMESPPQQAWRHYYLATIRNRQGQREAALSEMQTALRLMDGMAGTDSAISALWRLDYAEQLAAAGRRREARAQLASAAPVLRQQLAPAAAPLARLERLQRAMA